MKTEESKNYAQLQEQKECVHMPNDDMAELREQFKALKNWNTPVYLLNDWKAWQGMVIENL